MCNLKRVKRKDRRFMKIKTKEKKKHIKSKTVFYFVDLREIQDYKRPISVCLR